MSKYHDGDYIALDWGWAGPDYEVIRGHLPPLVAAYRVQQEIGDYSAYRGLPEPAWGRFECHGWSEHNQNFQHYDEPGRGRFPVMLAWTVHARTR